MFQFGFFVCNIFVKADSILSQLASELIECCFLRVSPIYNIMFVCFCQNMLKHVGCGSLCVQ